MIIYIHVCTLYELLFYIQPDKQLASVFNYKLSYHPILLPIKLI